MGRWVLKIRRKAMHSAIQSILLFPFTHCLKILFRIIIKIAIGYSWIFYGQYILVINTFVINFNAVNMKSWHHSFKYNKQCHAQTALEFMSLCVPVCAACMCADVYACTCSYIHI